MDAGNDLRSAERRTKIDRRTAPEALTAEERERIAERRVQPERRVAGDRRKKGVDAEPGSPFISILLTIGMLCLFDVRFYGGQHTIDPLQKFADTSNTKIAYWVATAFPSRN